MKYRTLLFASVLATLAAGCATTNKANIYQLSVHPGIAKRGQHVMREPLDRELLSSLVVDYINVYRNKRNLVFLAVEEQATHAAYWMANYQATQQMVSHRSATAGMERFGDRYRVNGGGAYACGYENAGWYPSFAPDKGRNYTYDEMARNIVDGWINSPSHHQCLLAKADGADGVIGLGVAPGMHGSDTGVYTTMNIFFYLPEKNGFTTRSANAIPSRELKQSQKTAPVQETKSQKKPTRKKK